MLNQTPKIHLKYKYDVDKTNNKCKLFYFDVNQVAPYLLNGPLLPLFKLKKKY